MDTTTRKKLIEIAVGGQPTDVCFTPDGRKAFVSNRLDDNVSVVDVATHKAVGTLTAGDEPHGVLVDKQGKYLYVLNTSIDSISVFDVATLQEVKQLSASRSPWSLAQSPDGKSIFVTHALSRFVEGRAPSMSEVTVIDADQATVKDRLVVKAANLLQGVAWDPSGDFAVITLLRTKKLVARVRVAPGISAVLRRGDHGCVRERRAEGRAQLPVVRGRDLVCAQWLRDQGGAAGIRINVEVLSVGKGRGPEESSRRHPAPPASRCS